MNDPVHRNVERARRLPVIELTRHDVFLPNLPPEASGIAIAQISDLHRGCGNADPLIMHAVGAVNALNPDYICITGDFIDGRRRDILPAAKLAAGLRARRGVYAVLGNHDQRGDPDLLRSALEAGGISVLHNRPVEIAPDLWLAGVDDIREGSPDFTSALVPVPHDAALILLCHIPNGAYEIPPGRRLLMLSGHTHGGQLRLPFPTPYMVCRFHLQTRFVHGWYRVNDVQLYVNRGIGVTGPPPLNRRRGCSPEITEFTLRPALADETP